MTFMTGNQNERTPAGHHFEFVQFFRTQRISVKHGGGQPFYRAGKQPHHSNPVFGGNFIQIAVGFFMHFPLRHFPGLGIMFHIGSEPLIGEDIFIEFFGRFEDGTRDALTMAIDLNNQLAS